MGWGENGLISVELGYLIAFGIPLTPTDQKPAEVVKNQQGPSTSVATSHWQLAMPWQLGAQSLGVIPVLSWWPASTALLKEEDLTFKGLGEVYNKLGKNGMLLELEGIMVLGVSPLSLVFC